VAKAVKGEAVTEKGVEETRMLKVDVELKEALRSEKSKLLGEILKLQNSIYEARKLVEELK